MRELYEIKSSLGLMLKDAYMYVSDVHVTKWTMEEQAVASGLNRQLTTRKTFIRRLSNGRYTNPDPNSKC